MDHTITPTWATVDLPILIAAVQADLLGDDVHHAVVNAARRDGATDRQAAKRLQALVDAGYLHSSRMLRSIGMVSFFEIRAPAASARREVEQWPNPGGLAEALAAAFEHAAADETDVDRKLSYRTAAQAIVTGVATTAITKYVGL